MPSSRRWLAPVLESWHLSIEEVVGILKCGHLDLAVALRTNMSDTLLVKGAEFVRRVRKLGRRTGTSVEIHPERGKGSHGTLYFGSRFTVVRNLKDELKTGTLHAMLKQLGLRLEDLED